MTTNGALLHALAQPLRDAGLDRLNLSLDTLQPEKFTQITRLGTLQDFHRGLQAAQAAGFTGTKLNVVLIGGFNTDEIGDFVALTQENDLCVRFIELMPMGPCAAWPERCFVPASTVLQAAPQLVPAGQDGVAQQYRIPGWRGSVGLISPMHHRFCGQCNRIRVLARRRNPPCGVCRRKHCARPSPKPFCKNRSSTRWTPTMQAAAAAICTRSEDDKWN